MENQRGAGQAIRMIKCLLALNHHGRGRQKRGSAVVVKGIGVESFLDAGIARKQGVFGRGLCRRNLYSWQIASQFPKALNHGHRKLGEWDESGPGKDHAAQILAVDQRRSSGNQTTHRMSKEDQFIAA